MATVSVARLLETLPQDGRRAETEHNKRSKRLHRLVGEAIADFQMIEAGDKVMVCLSGGKDSYGLLDILMSLQARAPIDFELIAVNSTRAILASRPMSCPITCRRWCAPFHIETQDTHSIVKRVIPEGQTMCSLCSRLRRGCCTGWPTNSGPPRLPGPSPG